MACSRLASEIDMSRFAIHPGGYHAAVRMSQDYAARSRAELDIDDPSIDTLQTLLLLEIAFKASGRGKKAYMMLGMWQHIVHVSGC